jgi:dTDP-4-dehydrorhamnose 3,5-epimerase
MGWKIRDSDTGTADHQMKFIATAIDGAFLIEMEAHVDERGYFARTRSDEEFLAHGLDNNLSECSISSNDQIGTLRGMHYQTTPHEETKLVTCVRGRIFDAIIDLRENSDSYMQTFSTQLSLQNRQALYIPAGVAHGFLTLEDNCYVQYQIGGLYQPDAARGVRWNDPAFAIEWPFRPAIISARDQGYEDYAS